MTFWDRILIPAVAAVLAFIAAIIGGWVQLRVQDKQFSQENETRFSEATLAAVQEFSNATADLIKHDKAVLNAFDPRATEDPYGELLLRAAAASEAGLEQFRTTLVTMRLVTSQRVSDAGERVAAAAEKVLKTGIYPGADRTAENKARLRNAVKKVEDAEDSFIAIAGRQLQGLNKAGE